MIMALKNNNPAVALQALEDQDEDSDNMVLENLHRGLLLHRLKQYKKSNLAFEKAKKRMESLYGTSVSEQITASVINDSQIEYAGSKYEQLIVHGFQILNYLFLNDVAGARVEALQANIKMNKWGEPKSGTDGYIWMHYLSAVVFEINREYDQALVSYRKAYKMADKTKNLSPAIYEPYIKILKKINFNNEYNKFSQKHQFVPKKDNQEVLLVFFAGTAPVKVETRLMRYSGDLGKNVGIVLPFYPTLNTSLVNSLKFLSIKNSGSSYKRTVMIESIDSLAREALKRDMPALITRSLLRQVTKRNLISQIDNSDNDNAILLGIIARITAFASERADTRSWFSLPNQIQIARIGINDKNKMVFIKSTGFHMKKLSLQPKGKEAIIPIAIFANNTR
jgi:uncharacterized protein